MHERIQRCSELRWGSAKKADHSELGVYGRTVITFVINEWDRMIWIGLIWLGIYICADTPVTYSKEQRPA